MNAVYISTIFETLFQEQNASGLGHRSPSATNKGVGGPPKKVNAAILVLNYKGYIGYAVSLLVSERTKKL